MKGEVTDLVNKDLKKLEKMAKEIALQDPSTLSGYYDDEGNWNQTIHFSVNAKDLKLKNWIVNSDGSLSPKNMRVNKIG